MSDLLLETIKNFEGKDMDQDEISVSHFSDNELLIIVKDVLDDETAAFVFGDNEEDREKAKQIIEVLQSYIDKSK
jgi:hypothetical protein